MTDTYSITEARKELGAIARRVQRNEHVLITDHGQPVAAVVPPTLIEDLEDALAVARLERDRALGIAAAPVPWSEARKALLEAAGRGE